MDKLPGILKRTDCNAREEQGVELVSLLRPGEKSGVTKNGTGGAQQQCTANCQHDGSGSASPNFATPYSDMSHSHRPLEAASINEDSTSVSGVKFEEILVDALDSSTLHVDWPPFSQSADVHGYKIKYSIKESSSYNEIFVPSDITSYTVYGLSPDTEYGLSVYAVDQCGSVLGDCGNTSHKTNSPMEGRNGKRLGSPYKAAIFGGTLLLIAAIVPISFLFLKPCGKCSSSSQRPLHFNSIEQNRGIQNEAEIVITYKPEQPKNSEHALHSMITGKHRTSTANPEYQS